jgi:hypothetical protein
VGSTRIATAEQAEAALLRLLERRGVGSPDELVIYATTEKPYGWVMHYDARGYRERGVLSDALVGQGPVILIAETGEIHELGSGQDPDTAVPEFERQLGLS